MSKKLDSEINLNPVVKVAFLGYLANSEQNPPRLAAGMNAFLNPGGYKGER